MTKIRTDFCMEMQICIKGILIALFFAMVVFFIWMIIAQIALSLACKKKIEATLIDVEVTQKEEGTDRVAVPHESRYSKYSYTYKQKREFTYKKRYSYTYHPVYEYEYDNQCFTRNPMNSWDYFEEKAFKNKKCKIGQKCYVYIDPKRPFICITKRFSLANTMLYTFCSIGMIWVIFLIFKTL